jgi:hypothetical protein
VAKYKYDPDTGLLQGGPAPHHNDDMPTYKYDPFPGSRDRVEFLKMASKDIQDPSAVKHDFWRDARRAVWEAIFNFVFRAGLSGFIDSAANWEGGDVLDDDGSWVEVNQAAAPSTAITEPAVIPTAPAIEPDLDWLWDIVDPEGAVGRFIVDNIAEPLYTVGWVVGHDTVYFWGPTLVPNWANPYGLPRGAWPTFNQPGRVGVPWWENLP